MISSVTEDQIRCVDDFVKRTPHLNARNNRLGKLGELAVNNLGKELGFSNAYGNDLHNSIFKILPPGVNDDGGADYVLQSDKCKYLRLIAQIKTTTSDPYNQHILLKKSMYDSKLNYDTKYFFTPIDIFIFVKQLSESTYDVVGFITREDALTCLKDDKPVEGCWGIHESKLRLIEDLPELFKTKSCK